jgi:hypothetical protein
MLWMHVRKVWRDMSATRPFSFYLLLAILVFTLLGSRVGSLREDPRRYAFFLSLSFIFFLVVLWRALVDAVEIARKHFREQHRLYRSTLGDSEFIRELGRRVGDERRDS